MVASTYDLIEITQDQPQASYSDGVLRDVKILGHESKNTGAVLGLPRSKFGKAVDEPYVYSQEALRRANARKIYDGVKVNINHLERNDDRPRMVSEQFGKVLRTRLKQDGIYGDVAYFTTSQAGKTVVEAAHRQELNDAFGLSQVAAGKVELVNGRVTVTDIAKPSSVDVVTEPATTRGLYESVVRRPIVARNHHRRMPLFDRVSFRELLDRLDGRTVGKAELCQLVEMDGAALSNQQMRLARPDSTPEEHILNGIRQAIIAKLEMAKPQQLVAVLKTLGVQTSMQGTDQGFQSDAPTNNQQNNQPPETDGGEPTIPEKPDMPTQQDTANATGEQQPPEKKVTESRLLAENELLRAGCQNPTDAFITAVAAAKGDERKQLIEAFGGKVEQQTNDTTQAQVREESNPFRVTGQKPPVTVTEQSDAEPATVQFKERWDRLKEEGQKKQAAAG